MSFVSYGEKEKAIVRSGISAIEAVLMGGNPSEKRSLLLALDWFMDPYYRQDVSGILEDLTALLQNAVISSEDEETAEDALGLLTSYGAPPFDILERNLDKVPRRLRPEALYAVNMWKED